MKPMLEAHPLADMFPMIEGEAFDDLVSSIKQHGLINPIIMLDGKILDGRNRYRACLAAGVEPDFADFDDEKDPQKWASLVDALNIQRRHLNDSQRAIIAAQLAGRETDGMYAAEAAKALNVGRRSVSKAVAVLKSGDTNVIELVQKGRTSVTRAEAVIKGELPRTALTERRGPGRPVGDTHVYRLRKAVNELLALETAQDKIVRNWPGDPSLNADVVKCVSFLRSLSQATQEADGAVAIA
ncbi:ParB N-terminal domain-containing protein [uncultured Hyphomicrobium sp.]|uniref:ParB/RepB/Spo0J family partition protein n=1 Tax=uncultured Hyphomicrobium sp. TaxID=194373 RepID=UPI0025F6F9FD|nr:ParB N-terminal domain-containing protein [uncultured Hyphomicrobium sp.]